MNLEQEQNEDMIEYNKAIEEGKKAFQQLAINAPRIHSDTINQIWDWCGKNKVSTSDKKELGLFWAYELCEVLGESDWRDLIWDFEYRPHNPIKRATAQIGIQKVALEFYWVQDVRYCEYLVFNKIEFLAANDGVNFISDELVQKILARKH